MVITEKQHDQEESFVAKVYQRTPWHRVEQIIDIEGDRLKIKTERAGDEESGQY